ncbi:hypothetical protein ACX1DX_11795 [Tessaracoccus sp. Y36]
MTSQTVQRDVRWGGRLVIVGIALLSVAAWGWLFQHWFLAGDDYAFLADPGHPRGTFTADYWWDSLVDDWARRNGRLSDAVLRLLLRPGEWFYPLFAPFMLTATGLGLSWAAVGRHPARQGWTLAVGLGILPVVCWLAPGMFGDGIFWAAGAVNYVAPLGLLALAIGVHQRLLAGSTVGWPTVALAGVAILLADAMQEVSSTASLAVAVGVVALGRLRLGAKSWFLVACAVVAFVVHMSSPGLWLRSGRVVGEATVVERVLHGTSVSASMLLTRGWPLWFAVVALLAATAMRQEPPRWGRWVLAGAAAIAAAFFVVAGMFRTRVPSLSLEEFPSGRLPLMAVVFALMVLAMAAVGVALTLSARRLGTATALAWLGFAGSCVFVFASGVANTRVHLMPLALLALTVAAALARLTVGRRANRRVAGGLALLLVVPSAVWFDATLRGVRENERFVEGRIVGPIEAAVDADAPVEVEVPHRLPHPEMTYPRAFVSGYLPTLHIYYGLPDHVALVPVDD